MKLESFSQMVESNGRTVRENNLAISHKIPVGTLVEAYSSDFDYEWNGIRLFVLKHTRDCDGSPLYSLGYGDKLLSHGYSEDCLRELPQKEHGDE